MESRGLSASERALARVGTTVRGYRLQRLLGLGGMAAVYAAIDRDGHHVAIKFVLDRYADDPHVQKLFRREAHVANEVGHPGAVPVLDSNVDERGTPFLVMPLLEGETVRTRWQRANGRLPIAEVGTLMLDALDVLASAHTKGIVHRDIKPDNLFITHQGRLRVLDFGIARRLRDEGTASAAVVGTAAFMPPEQALGDRNAIGPHSDCWAVGATMFQLLSGETVHRADNAGAWIAAAATQPARSLGEVLPGAHSAIVRVVDKALAFEPRHRWRSAIEMKEALLAALEDALGAPFIEAAEKVRTRLASESMPGPHEAETHRAARPARRWRSNARRKAGAAWVAGVGAIALLGGGTFAWPRATSPTMESASPAAAALAAECRTHAECVQQHGGANFVCRKSNGTCVSLETPECTVFAEKGDVENEGTFWIGAMFPMTGRGTPYGRSAARTADLARRDFARVARGLPSPRPIALLMCDDAEKANEVAQHLLDIEAPAVIGFGGIERDIQRSTARFISNRVLTIAAMSRDSLLTAIPQPADAPRLVWRTTFARDSVIAAKAAVVTQLIEPELRANGVLGEREHMRVAHLRARSTTGLEASNALLDLLRFNGRNVFENGRNFREISYGAGDSDPIPDESVVSALLEFRPHAIIAAGFDERDTHTLLAPFEQRWPSRENFRPHYVVTGYFEPAFRRFMMGPAERRRRFIGVRPPSSTLAAERLSLHYQETYSPAFASPHGPTPPVYDAMYLLAYAAYAIGDEPITGPGLARAISRLGPPGEPIDVGPGKVFEAFKWLREGKSIDLQGAASSLDFDLATGEARTDFALTCAGWLELGVPKGGQEPGPIFRAATKSIEGLPLNCR